jgi:hypothetical protein
MPFEIIVNDDGSHVVAADTQIFSECRKLCSTLIFNSGVNMGFASSANRGVALANSRYVLLMNDDTLMSGPALRLVKLVLDRPYVGAFGPWAGEVDPVDTDSFVHIQIGDNSFRLSGLPSGSSVFAFRKDLWQQIGGFPQVYHNGGDIAFLHRLCQSGFFAVRNDLVGVTPFRNVDVEENYRNATFTRSMFDSSYPQIFGVPNLAELHLARAKRVYDFSHNEYLKEFGLHNTDSWYRYFAGAKLTGKNNYDWTKLSRFGQDAWRQYVEGDIL